MVFDGVAKVRIQSVKIVAGDHAKHSRVSLGLGFIDGDDFGVRQGAAQHLGVRHADQSQIRDVLRLAGDLDPAVPARNGMIDDVKIGFLWRAHRSLSLVIRLARWIAATMGTYPVQRQILPSM